MIFRKTCQTSTFVNSLCSPNLSFTYLGKDAYHEMPFGTQFMSTDEKLCVLNSYADGYFTAVKNPFNQYLWWFHECDIIMNDKIFKINVLECASQFFFKTVTFIFFPKNAATNHSIWTNALTFHRANYLITSMAIYCIWCIIQKDVYSFQHTFNSYKAHKISINEKKRTNRLNELIWKDTVRFLTFNVI